MTIEKTPVAIAVLWAAAISGFAPLLVSFSTGSCPRPSESTGAFEGESSLPPEAQQIVLPFTGRAPLQRDFKGCPSGKRPAARSPTSPDIPIPGLAFKRAGFK
eukprot:CAMPEP_0177751538 /NCGR_PEP_ID=MMETSP0491_2-20121128/427_1 /TAXON_ID=63592 /ORGANISM="Tetraselmis chuii, Strain PLY429" /LENGTH=102 /DNA_ID=CAMNT_0019266657 /DNA_START=977 /DNA_END=1285 /DNA_ORIENTATION=-